ncbi:MAG: M1 family metallopeptidase [Chlorobi bacterium]|nr:M1 family metallopeptidase [Chlorobiota bacterium]
MFWRGLLMVFVLGAGVGAYGQCDPNRPPNTYRSKCNPHYWKNRKPYSDYWQQDVYYKIRARVDEQKHTVSGRLTLVYWNNSPDTLREAFFHLYQNAFQPNSYYHQLWRDNFQEPKFGEYERQGLGTQVHLIKADGIQLKPYIDNTIMHVRLPRPLPPNDFIVFEIEFTTYFDDGGSMRRRMKMFDVYVKKPDGTLDTFKHYDGVHWYPRIAVYDRRFGWTTDQHLDKEFYGDIGTYDVVLDFPANYVVEATGTLLNREEVFPDTLFKALHMENFKDVPWNSPASEVIPYDPTKRKKWHFYAENVHDFAFTADPTYRIDTAIWQDVVCVALVQEGHASRWQTVAEFTKKVVALFSRDFGRYIYPKIVVADARDGMEYPMITLCGGAEPSNYGLIAHEVGHMWFFGMINSNETYRAFLDEGFTQFLTVWALENLGYGKYFPAWKKLHFKHRLPLDMRELRAYRSYIMDAQWRRDMPLATHSSDFNNALRHGGGYRHVYVKTATMLYHLQYILGDSLFLQAMKNYFNRWYLCHPYEEDLRYAFADFLRIDLNRFWDYYFYTTKRVDYQLLKPKLVSKEDGKYTYVLRIKRKEEFPSPLDIRVTDKEGNTYDYIVPDGWFIKDSSLTPLKQWYGWGYYFNTYYEDTIVTKAPIKSVEIDTSFRLPDIYPIDNAYPRKLRQKWKFYWHIWQPLSWKYRLNQWRPALWFNGADLLQVGIRIKSQYLNYRHNWELWTWVNSGYFVPADVHPFSPLMNSWAPISVVFRYRTAVEKLLPLGRVDFTLYALSGVVDAEVSLRWKLKSPYARPSYYVKLGSVFERVTPYVFTYSLYPYDWKIGNFLWQYVEVEKRHNKFGRRNTARLRVSAGLVPLTNQFASFEYEWKQVIPKKLFVWRHRVFVRQDIGNIPQQIALYVDGGDARSLLDHPLTWARFFPHQALRPRQSTYVFHEAGGLNLRGYAGYGILPDGFNMLYRPTGGIAYNAELVFTKAVRWQPRLLSGVSAEGYLFADVGYFNISPVGISLFDAIPWMDAGLGFVFTVRRVGAFDGIKPLTVRVDMPFFLNRPPAVEQFVQPRFQVAVSKLF